VTAAAGTAAAAAAAEGQVLQGGCGTSPPIHTGSGKRAASKAQLSLIYTDSVQQHQQPSLQTHELARTRALARPPAITEYSNFLLPPPPRRAGHTHLQLCIYCLSKHPVHDWRCCADLRVWEGVAVALLTSSQQHSSLILSLPRHTWRTT
jgi:hypothetical protein